MVNHRDAHDRPLYAARMNRVPESAGAARQLVSRALQAWELMELEDTAWLVITELVANAVMHAKRSTLRVSVTRMDARTVRLVVLDRSIRMPKPRDAGPDDVSGRGLALVALMCDGHWGTERMRDGKRVWADVLMPEENPGG